jgi:hypothetical protein
MQPGVTAWFRLCGSHLARRVDDRSRPSCAVARRARLPREFRLSITRDAPTFRTTSTTHRHPAQTGTTLLKLIMLAEQDPPKTKSSLPAAELLEDAIQAAGTQDFRGATKRFLEWAAHDSVVKADHSAELVEAYRLGVDWALSDDALVEDARKVGDFAIDFVERSAADKSKFDTVLAVFDKVLGGIVFQPFRPHVRGNGFARFKRMPNALRQLFGEMSGWDLKSHYDGSPRDRALNHLSARSLKVVASWCEDSERPDLAFAATEVGSSRYGADGPWELDRLSKDKEAYANRRRMLGAKVRLLEENSRDAAWLAWPGERRCLMWRGQGAKDLGVLKRIAASDLVNDAFLADLEFRRFVDASPSNRNPLDSRDGEAWPALTSGRASIHSDAQGWGDWANRSALLSFFASPIAWTFVWMLPLMLVFAWMDKGFAGPPFHFGWRALPTASGTGLVLLIWMFALSRCRVTRILRVGRLYAEHLCMAVPVPLWRLPLTDVDLAHLDTVYGELQAKSYQIEAAGAFVKVNQVLFKRNVFASFGVETRHTGLLAIGWGVGAGLVGTLLTAAAAWLHGRALEVEMLANAWAAPYFAAIQALVVLLGVGSALAFVAALVFAGAARGWKHKEFMIGFYDMQRRFVPLFVTSSWGIGQPMLDHIQTGIQRAIGDVHEG